MKLGQLELLLREIGLQLSSDQERQSQTRLGVIVMSPALKKKVPLLDYCSLTPLVSLRKWNYYYVWMEVVLAPKAFRGWNENKANCTIFSNLRIIQSVRKLCIFSWLEQLCKRFFVFLEGLGSWSYCWETAKKLVSFSSRPPPPGPSNPQRRESAWTPQRGFAKELLRRY